MTNAKEKIDFIGIGSTKSGTTWIGDCLAAHPEVLFSSEKSIKELHFFTESFGEGFVFPSESNYRKGIEWYLKQFPEAQAGKARGEFCNSYLVDQKAPGRIKQHFPDAKIIVSLRNPADMLHSLFWWCRASVKVETPETFERAVKEQWFFNRAEYHRLLLRYFKLFSKENVHVIIFEDIKTQSSEVLKKLYGFLGVGESFSPKLEKKKINPAIEHKSKLIESASRGFINGLKKVSPKVYHRFVNFASLARVYHKVNSKELKYLPPDERLKKEVINYFLKDIEELEKLIERDLSHWKV